MTAEPRLHGPFNGSGVVCSHKRNASPHRALAPAQPELELEVRMSEFFRSGAIILMGVIVMGAGVAVVFYG